MTITIRDADDSQGEVTFEGLGSGQDAGDKAVMKANTAALKYAYIGGLNIAMSDDPEQDLSGKAITSKVVEYSQKKFGKKLCYNCQNGGEATPF